MAQPQVQWRLDYLPYHNYAGKLSTANPFITPDGTQVDPRKVDLYIDTNEYLENLYITVVKEGDEYGFIDDVLVDLTTGICVVDYAKVAAGSMLKNTLDAANHFVKGGGEYRIGIYAQNSEGLWNYEYFFVTVNGEKFMTSNEEYLMVPVNAQIRR